MLSYNTRDRNSRQYRTRASKRQKRSTSEPSQSAPTYKFLKKHANNYTLMGHLEGLTPVGVVANLLSRTLLGSKNRNPSAPIKWQSTVERLKLIKAKRDKDKHQQKKRRPLSTSEKEKAKVPQQVVGLVRAGVKLGLSMAGQNVSDFDKKTLKLISPKFFSVADELEEGDNEKNETINLLSPSLLSMHPNGGGSEIERALSLPTLTKDFTGRDQQEWLNLIVEAAGVNDAASEMEEKEMLSDNGKRRLSPV